MLLFTLLLVLTVWAAAKLAAIQVKDEIAEIEHEARMEVLKRETARLKALRESLYK